MAGRREKLEPPAYCQGAESSGTLWCSRQAGLVVQTQQRTLTSPGREEGLVISMCREVRVRAPISFLLAVNSKVVGFPDGSSGKEPACQCRRCERRGFDP